MRLRFGQLICFVAGVLLLSVGGGLVGGRRAARSVSVPKHPAETAASLRKYRAAEAGPEAVSDARSVPFLITTEQKQTEPFPDNFSRPASPLKKNSLNANVSTGRLVEGTSQALSPKYVVQAISTSNRGDASTARKKIMDEGFPAGIFEADLGKRGRWYRVYVGPYESEAEAQMVLESVRRIPGFKASFVKSVR